MRYIYIIFLLKFSSIFAQSAQLISPDVFMHHSTIMVLDKLEKIESDKKEDLLAIIQSTIMPHVDSTFMAKWVVGRQPWISATKIQQDEFVEAFMDLLVASYANTLVIFKDKKLDFKLANKKPVSSTAQVLCTVGQVGKDPIHVIFQMKVIDDQWKVFDVIIEGISLLKGLKAQFSDDIHNFGISVVTERIKKHQYKVKGPSSS